MVVAMNYKVKRVTGIIITIAAACLLISMFWDGRDNNEDIHTIKLLAGTFGVIFGVVVIMVARNDKKLLQQQK